MEKLFAIQTQDEQTFKNAIKEAVMEAFAEVSPIKPQDKFYTRQELARELHVSLVSIDKAIDNGKLKSLRFGGRVLFKASDIKLDEVQFRRHRKV